jgi:vancomycin resistance protein YoaR
MRAKPISSLISRSRRAIIGAVIAAAFVVPYVILQIVAGFGVPRNVMVADVMVGGLSGTQATARLQSVYANTGILNVTIKDTSYELGLGDLGVKVDVAETLRSIQADRWNPFALVGMLLGKQQAPALEVEDQTLTAALVSLAAETDIPARDANVDVRNLSVISAKRGARLDIAESKAIIIDAIAAGRHSVTLVRERKPALVSTLVAERALQEIAIPAVSDAVTVDLTLPDGTHRTSVISPTTIRAALSFTRSGSLLEPRLDGAVLRRDVDATIFDIQTEARDATFEVNGESVSVVPSRDGFGVTSDSLANDVLKVLRLANGQRAVALTLGTIPAAFSTADAEALNIKERVSWYRQRFPAAAYRTINIGTAAKRINGTLLMPGQIFSMNDTVKERTVENGYTEGWIIGPDGVFKNELGGAVSTITTAMFNAAWFAGLEFVEHRAHSIYIPRYRPGREATVSWGSFDMRFKNTLANPIYITTELRKTSITVYFWGTKEFSKVDSIFGPWENKRPYPELTGVLPDCHAQDGIPGFQITVWRVLYKNDVEVKREPYRTSYRPSPHVVCKKPPAPAPTPSPTVPVVETPNA